ncbi:unnamed protein product [Cyclocybe aegerita]|uniref:Ricin B lectin domain-containing protein n=1 Tax=Cyclocybe aegerita TaxID=1973307 RepID=A0A8S0WM35_CYCAE|nr:unnamed protein product [Cyclocybe aegerita]
MVFSPIKILQAFLPLFAFLGANAERRYTIRNRCPESIKLYISGKSHGIVPSGHVVTKVLADNWSGLIYTSSNGGNPNGVGTTRAGFFGLTGYYYVVRDEEHFNTGVTIAPKIITKDFCTSHQCDSATCSAFTTPPTRFPVPSSNPPTSPLFACPGILVDYTVTFCPSGAFPPPSNAVNIHPNNNTNKCLDVRGAHFRSGTPVQIYDCNGTAAQRWVVERGASTQIRLAGTPYCLDASSDPKNAVKTKIWRCHNKLPAQTWMYNEDNEIVLKRTVNSNFLCLDLTYGSTANSNPIQMYLCYYNNPNQIWTTSPL